MQPAKDSVSLLGLLRVWLLQNLPADSRVLAEDEVSHEAAGDAVAKAEQVWPTRVHKLTAHVTGLDLVHRALRFLI